MKSSKDIRLRLLIMKTHKQYMQTDPIDNPARSEQLKQRYIKLHNMRGI
jgi:hypothetical protein